MSRIVLAFRAFFASLLDGSKSAAIKAVLSGVALQKSDAVEKLQRDIARPVVSPPARSEAITLLAALQREARLVDLVKQPLANFSDEQIGAAARTVLGDCQKVLDRFFGLELLADAPEGSDCDVPAGYDPGRYKLSGRVEGSGPFHGQLIHPGWHATTVKLPEWTGSKDAALIIAPAEVEIA
ncbi:MAG TPA: DUF2760 domain-containing protein [Pirellulaceae bacterium]|jgi:hypothetical protein